MGELKPQSALPNVNVTLADRGARESSRTETRLHHISWGRAPIFGFPFWFHTIHSFCKESNQSPFEMLFGARGK